MASVRRQIFAGALLLTTGLAGCAVGPDYQMPILSVPETFIAKPVEHVSKSEERPSVDLNQWWRSLRDRELDSLIARALQSNLDLEIALTRLQEAQAQMGVEIGQALPSVDGSGGAATGTGTDNTNGRALSLLRSGDNRTNLTRIDELGGLAASWELDIFGKFRRRIEAANADAEALADARDWVFVTVAADVARAYLDMRALQGELSVLQQNIRVAQNGLDLAQTRFNRGLTNEMDVTLAQRQLATLQSDVAPLEAQIAVSQHVIATLLGQFPEDLAKELAKPGPIPVLPARIPVGLPVDLLRRRPDIHEAERRLAAATARIGVATADLFPSVIVSAAGGAQGGPRTSASAIPLTMIGSLGPALYWPVLDFGTLDAKIEIADLQSHELMISYKQSILAAVQQVDDAIALFRAEQDRLRNLDRALAAAHKTTKLATEQYDRGLTDFLNVVDAERQEFDLEEQQVAARRKAAQELIALYKALGGGWPLNEVLPPLRQPQPAIIAAARQLFGPRPRP
jgi:NodT family efflux transporter outer membrane factor (OMF) lipoprotein